MKRTPWLGWLVVKDNDPRIESAWIRSPLKHGRVLLGTANPAFPISGLERYLTAQEALETLRAVA